MTDRVTRWVLPVDENEEGLIITLPPDLLEQMNMVEGDQLEWKVTDDGTLSLNRLAGNQ